MGNTREYNRTYYNARRAGEIKARLVRALAANFDGGAAFVELDFSALGYRPTRSGCQFELRNFLRKLRAEAGEEFRAVYSLDMGEELAARLVLPPWALDTVGRSMGCCDVAAACAVWGFRPEDLFLTLTYRKGDEPQSRMENVARVRTFIKALRAHWRRQGKVFRYAYAVESGCRAHLLLNSAWGDTEAARRLWVGEITTLERVGEITRTHPEGAQVWTVSRNLPPMQAGAVSLPSGAALAALSALWECGGVHISPVDLSSGWAALADRLTGGSEQGYTPPSGRAWCLYAGKK